MKLLFNAVTITSLAQLALGNAVTSECNGESTRGELVITIPYTVQGSEILSFRAGSCSAVGDARFSQTATHATVTVDIDDCDLDTSVRDDILAVRNLAAGYYTAGAEVELGRADGTFHYSMYKATINTECGTETNYVARYDYGTIDHQTHADDLLPGTYNEYTFTISAYTDATYDTVADPATSSRAGSIVYLAVHPTAADFSYTDYAFAVTGCTITNNEQSSDAALYKSDANDCGNTFVDLSMSYTDGQWRMSHKSFVFGDGSVSTYGLTCAVRLCEFGDDDSQCAAAHTACIV